MTPGKTFEDELKIENLTNDSYMLYIKIKKESISTDELELLSNINIVIHNEEKDLLYDGPSTGLEYKVDNQLVDDIIFIGYYEPFTKDNLKVRSTLKKDYENTENLNLNDVEWEFYAMSDSKTEIINPNTQDTILRYIVIFVITLILFIIFIYFRKKKKI